MSARPGWGPVVAAARPALAASESVDEVARATLDLLIGAPDVIRAGFAVEQAAGRQLSFLPTERLANDRPAWCEIDGLADVPLVRALLTGSPVLFRDLEELGAAYPHLVRRQASLGTCALAAVPLVDGGARIGALLVSFDEPQSFDASEVDALLDIAHATASRMAFLRDRGRAAGDEARAPDADAWTRVDPTPAAPRTARRFLRDRLYEWGLPRERVETAELCLSEVVTNAVLHARTAIGVLLTREDDRIRVVVEDGGRDQQVTRRVGAGPDDVGGRGLLLVEELTVAWGSEQSERGTAVWFEVGTDEDDVAS